MSDKVTKQFCKEDLINCVFQLRGPLERVETDLVENDRWSLHYSLVFRDPTTQKLYRTHYTVGATEMQDLGPFEYEEDFINCTEVTLVEVKRFEYQDVLSS